MPTTTPSVVAAETAVRVCDWTRSFLHFRVDVTRKPPRTVSHQPPFTLNHVRVPLECRLTVENRRDGARQDFHLTANCKTERVHVPRDIWTQPNADVVFVAGGDRFLIVKTFDHCDRKVMLHPPTLGEQPHRQIVDPAEAFDAMWVNMQWSPGERLTDTAQVIDAILAGHPLTSRTTIETARYRADIEYPIKTVNCSPRDGYYQTDTGPVLVPDLDREPGELIEGLSLAFVAHAEPDWAEFILREPTPIGHGLRVEHYARSLRLENIHNEVIRCD